MSQPLKIFISYARKDAAFKEELLLHLKPFIRKGVIESWHDGDVEAGSEWEPEIFNNLATADVILFLISPAFIASDYIYSKEIRKAEERYARKETVIVPIWIKPVGIPDDFLNKFQSLPRDRKPVSQWADHDEAWVDVVTRLNQLFNKIHKADADTSKNIPFTRDSKNIHEINDVGFSKNNIRDLISRGKTKDALKLILHYTEGNDPDSHNSLTLLSARFREMERNDQLGIASNADLQLERNRINLALLSLLDDIE